MLFEALVTVLAATRTTELAARVTGVRTFLPLLSAKRFSTVGALDEAVVISQMDACKSFKDVYWTKYWIAFADNHLGRLNDVLAKNNLEPIQPCLDDSLPSPSSAVVAFIRQGAAAMTKTVPGAVINLDELSRGVSSETKSSFVAVDALLKAIAYYFIAAWPGQTPARIRAYRVCERLFDILLDAVAPTLNLTVERHFVKTAGEEVKVYGPLPHSREADVEVKMPGILITNGLEGTNVETMTTALRTQSIVSSAWFFMEMPGTYAYKQPMSKTSSEQVYRDVISFMAAHESVDALRLGMIGISFGGNCATRMAVSDKRLKAVVMNGAPLAQSLRPTASFGMPEVVAQALFHVVGATGLQDLKGKLGSLTPSRREIEGICCPVLAINGENDTLISTKDTMNLAAWAPRSRLCLYPGDDHCAMGHIREWMDLCSAWLQENL